MNYRYRYSMGIDRDIEIRVNVKGWMRLGSVYNYGVGKPHYPMPAIYDVRLDEEMTDTFVSLIRMSARG